MVRKLVMQVIALVSLAQSKYPIHDFVSRSVVGIDVPLFGVS